MGVEHGLEGALELAIVDGIDPKNFRGKVKSPFTGGRQNCIFNPSPYIGMMPLPNSLVAVYRKQGWFARMLMPVAEIVGLDERTADERLNERTEEPPGSIMRLEPGECFFGRYGRIFMDKNGSVKAFTSLGSQSLTLNAVTRRVEISGHDFVIKSHGQGIKVFSEKSTPLTYGDTFKIEKNVPMPGIPDELPTPPPPPTNISRFEIDEAGGITIGAVKTSPESPSSELVLSPMAETGTTRLRNVLSSLTMFGPVNAASRPAGDVLLTNSSCDLDFGIDGKIRLGNKSAQLEMLPSGNVTVDGLAVSVNSDGEMSLLSSSTMSMQSSGNMSVTAPTLNISAVTNVSNAFTVSGASPTVLTGGLSVTGLTTLTGVVTIVATPIMTGVPVAVPLATVTTVAKIPVLVNGVIVGFIPVIP